MEFTFNNFAKAGSGTVHVKDLTVICGPNNSGKTYLNYAIHSILWDFLNLFDFGWDEEELKTEIRKLESDSEVHLDLSKTFLSLVTIANKGYSIEGSTLYNYFQVNKNYFKKSNISFKLSDIDFNKKIIDSGILIPDLIQFNYIFKDGKCNMRLYRMKESSRSEYSINNYLKKEENILFIINNIKVKIFQNHFSDIVPLPFVVTAERTGVGLLYKSYDAKNSELLRSINGMNRSSSISQLKNMKTKLFYPLELNIRDLRSYNILKENESIFVKHKFVDILNIFSDLIDSGSYDLKDDEIFYKPSKKLSNMESEIPFHATSSSIKSFFSLNLFIRHIAEFHRMLIIDEPELNLYIDKQVKFARLVARLVNSGIKVLVTTHSDYFIRELNNLITMNSLQEEYRRESMKKFGILECDILDHSKVSAYKTDPEEDIQELEVSSVGIDPRNWNKLIDRENYKFEYIYYSPKKPENEI